MNPQRVNERGIRYHRACSARLRGFELSFDKASTQHPGVGHANLVYSPNARVEGVLYHLTSADEIYKMDRFERTPVNYSREVVEVESAEGNLYTWTYFANPAVRRAGLNPPRSYLSHLLAGRPFLSAGYYERLADWPCDEDR